MKIDEKKLREILAEQGEKTKRYVEVLREESARHFDIIAKKYLGLSKKE